MAEYINVSFSAYEDTCALSFSTTRKGFGELMRDQNLLAFLERLKLHAATVLTDQEE